MGLQQRLETHHQLRFNSEALDTSIDLSERFLPDRFFPDKAIDVIDEAGAYERLQTRPRRRIGANEIARTVARMSNLPGKINHDQRQRLKLRRASLGKTGHHFNVRAIKVARAGLASEEKPVGSFLFVAPGWAKQR